MNNQEGEGKGKGKALSNESTKASTKAKSPQETSLLSRVSASATGLTQSAFAAPTNSEINKGTSSALLNFGKGQSISRSGGESTAWAESSKTPQLPTYGTTGSSALRHSHNEEHIRQTENDFSNFLDGIEPFKPDGVVDEQAFSKSINDAWTRAQRNQVEKSTNRSVAEQEERDGEEVLSLLADPNTGDERFETEPEVEEGDLDWGLSSEQLMQLKAMTKELFPLPEPHKKIAADNPLNLMPKLDEGFGMQQIDHSAAFKQWEGVLTRYADEVWGGLLPLVKEARQEVVDIKEGTQESGKTIALRRLESIFGHLQKR